MNNSLTIYYQTVVKQFQGLVLAKNILKNRNEFLRQSFHSSPVRKHVKPQKQATLNIFDRKAKKLQRERATLLEQPENYDYLKDEIGYRLADRIFDIKRKFSKAIDLGCSRGYVSRHVAAEWVEELIMADQSEMLMANCTCEDPAVKTRKVVCDEEHLTEVFEPNSIDLVISNLALHWVNQLPGCFEQILKILKIDGVFLASMFGIETLYELRSSLQLAEIERKGGVSPHISPFTRPTDIGGLLARAGFAMQTIDIDEIVVRYPTMFDLLEDLKGMGESNAAFNRCIHLSRDTLLAASAIYEHLYANTKINEGEDSTGIPATFQIIYLIGWKPDPARPPPPQKDPTMVSLRDFYKIDEVGIGKPIRVNFDGKECSGKKDE